MADLSHRSPELGNYKKFEGPKSVVLKIDLPLSNEILTT
jgi:hypothetical protein